MRVLFARMPNASNFVFLKTRCEARFHGALDAKKLFFYTFVLVSVIGCCRAFADNWCPPYDWASEKTATFEKARLGDAAAQYKIGYIYSKGCAEKLNLTEALKWYGLAAQNGHMDAQNNLGAIYAEGRGVAKNEVDAKKWYQKAADAGHARAQANLGYFYADGRGGVKQDKEKALYLWKKAAVKGDVTANYALCSVNMQGEIVRKDYDKARTYCMISAGQGHEPAQYLLGSMFSKGGPGLQKNPQEAARWWLQAANNGEPRAQYMMGLVSEKIDPLESRRWFDLAAKQGYSRQHIQNVMK